eukprot:293499-Amphidinium_carterae.1
MRLSNLTNNCLLGGEVFLVVFTGQLPCSRVLPEGLNRNIRVKRTKVLVFTVLGGLIMTALQTLVGRRHYTTQWKGNAAEHPPQDS